MIRHKVKSELTGLVYKTVFASQLKTILRNEKNHLIAHQGPHFSDDERRQLFDAGYGPSERELWRLYAEGRVLALHAHWQEIGRKILRRYRLIKNKFFPPKKLHPLQRGVSTFPIRSITSPSGKTYWQDETTKAWFLSLADAEAAQAKWLAEQDQLGFSKYADTARAIHAAKAFHVDSRTTGATIGNTVIKATLNNVYLGTDKTIIATKGNKFFVKAKNLHPWHPERFFRLPDGEILIEVKNCIHGGQPIEVFASECYLNRQLKLVGPQND